jgi:Thermostable hemolysin
MTISASCQRELKIELSSSRDVQGALCLDGERIRRLSRLRPVGIVVASRSHPDRRRVEGFIEEIYRRNHGSTITQHYPTLISLHAVSGDVIGAIGLRSAGGDPLFLEQYLQAPVEEVICRVTGQSMRRDQIAEVGSLASAGYGASAFLIIAAAAVLESQRFKYAVVTATAALRHILASLGFAHTVLGAARSEALADAGHSWGDYYANRPQMLAGAIAPAFALLDQYLPFEQNADLVALLAAMGNQV